MIREFLMGAAATFNDLAVRAGAPGIKRDATEERWWNGGELMATSAGIHIDRRTAIQHPVVAASLKVLAETLAALPLHIYENTGDGNSARRDNHPLAAVLSDQASAEFTAYEFWEAMMWDLAFERNALAEIRPGPRGAVDQLIYIRWEDVHPRRLNSGAIAYEITENGQRRILLPDEVWHLRKSPLCENRLSGRSVLETNSELIGRAIAVQRYGATFFANGGISGGVIEGLQFETDQAMGSFLRRWRQARTGANAHRDALMPPGGKYHPQEVNNEHAQFLGTDQETSRQLARLWRMPPHKVGILEDAKYANIEMQSIEFVMDTMLPWVTMIEQAIQARLMVNSRRFYARFNLSGLLRGDTKSRFEAYAQGIQNGWLSPNDVRRLENLNPIDTPAANQYYRNAALVPLETPARLPSGQSTDVAAAMAELASIRREKDAEHDEGE